MTMTSNDTAGGEALRVMFDRLALSLRTATPGVVVAVDPSGRYVDVQPAVDLTHRLDGEARALPMPVLRGVPLQVLGSTSRGLFVSVPVSPGDDGMLVVSDRALDAWQYGDGTAPPPDQPTPRHHDATDAVFIPGLQRMSGAIPSYPADAVQIRTRAGDCVVEVGANRVHARTPDGCDVLLQAGAVTMAAPGGAVLAVSGDTVTITGKLVVSTSVAAPSVLAAGKELAGHKHGGVAAGGSQTGVNV